MRRLTELVFCLALVVFVLSIYFSTHSVSSAEISRYYLQNFIRDTSAQNAVAAIYLNYRMYDSIFETLILLASVTAVINFSWRKKDEE